MKKLITVLAALLQTLSGCEKDSRSDLEIYILKDYQTKSPGHEIIPGSERLPKDPFIYYFDIISYDSTDHYFVIDSSKSREMSKTPWPTQGTAFALTIDRKIIYSGYFIPGYSSSTSDWYSMDPLCIDGKLRITLGYPVDREELRNPDLRNDPRIIKLLIEDKKLD